MVLLMSSCDKRAECRIDVEDLPGERINKAIKNFTKKLKTCPSAGGGHIKHKFLKHSQVFFSNNILKFYLLTFL